MEKIRIFLGLHGDTHVYTCSTAIPGVYPGIINAGPATFLQFLETHLGLAGIFPSMQDRVLKLKPGIDTIKTDPEFLFSTSYENDPLGVSKRLLNLWDGWRISGWEAEINEELPPRMKMLSVFSALFKGAGPGEPDRLLAVINSLKENNQLPPITLTLIDQVEFFPHLYQVLFKIIKGCIEKQEIPLPTTHLTDLDKLKWVLGGKKTGDEHKKLTNDGSLLILHFPDDIQAASAVFSIRQKTGWNPLLVNADNGLLNGLSLRQGKPVCNWQLSGGNGQIIQLFFLATAMFKRPLQATDLIAFYQRHTYPLEKKLATQLVEIFAAKPGILNNDWLDCIAAFKKEIADEEGDKQQIAAISFWLENLYELKDGNFSIKIVQEIYSKLQHWAIKRVHMPTIDVISQMQLLQLSSLCIDLVNSLDIDGLFISEAKLEGLQSQLFSDSNYTIRDAEAGSGNTVNHPANVWTLSEETIWMDAIRTESAALSSAWFTEEKKFLRLKGYDFPDNSTEYKVTSDGIRRMIFNTTKRLVLVIPAKYHGAKTYTPYCLDEWKERLDLADVTHHCNELLKHIPWSPTVGLTKNYPALLFPKPANYIPIPAKDYTRESESYTSIEKLIQHPLQWFFDYQLYLTHKAGTSFPDESSLRGTIADTVVQKLFTNENTKEHWWMEDVLFEKKVLQTLEQTLQEEGSLFLQDGFKRSIIEYRKLLCRHLSNLKKIIEINKFKIVATQYACEGSFNEQAMAGSIDLLLERNDQYFIIDLKWAFSTNPYIKRIQEGTDLQLALYQKMLPKANASGYFLLNDGKLLVRKSGLNLSGQAVNYIEANEQVSAENTCLAAQRSIHFRKQELKEGKLETGYDRPLEEMALLYHEKQPVENLYPLQDSDGFKKPPYTSDLNLYLGLTI